MAFPPRTASYADSIMARLGRACGRAQAFAQKSASRLGRDSSPEGVEEDNVLVSSTVHRSRAGFSRPEDLQVQVAIVTPEPEPPIPVTESSTSRVSIERNSVPPFRSLVVRKSVPFRPASDPTTTIEAVPQALQPGKVVSRPATNFTDLLTLIYPHQVVTIPDFDQPASASAPETVKAVQPRASAVSLLPSQTSAGRREESRLSRKPTIYSGNRMRPLTLVAQVNNLPKLTSVPEAPRLRRRGPIFVEAKMPGTLKPQSEPSLSRRGLRSIETEKVVNIPSGFLTIPKGGRASRPNRRFVPRVRLQRQNSVSQTPGDKDRTPEICTATVAHIVKVPQTVNIDRPRSHDETTLQTLVGRYSTERPRNRPASEPLPEYLRAGGGARGTHMSPTTCDSLVSRPYQARQSYKAYTRPVFTLIVTPPYDKTSNSLRQQPGDIIPAIEEGLEVVDEPGTHSVSGPQSNGVFAGVGREERSLGRGLAKYFHEPNAAYELLRRDGHPIIQR